FNKGIVFLTLPIFTYLLSPSDFGIISIFATFVSILIVFFGFNSHTSLVRRFHENENDFKDYLGTNLIFIVFINLFFLLMTYLFRVELSDFFKIDSKIILIASIVASLSIFMQMELSYLQTSFQSKKYTKILIIRNIVITFGALIWMNLLIEEKYLGKIYSDLLIMFFVFLYVFYKLYKMSNFSFNFNHLKYNFLYGIPLIPHSIAGLVLLQADRLMINKFLGEYETGIYSFASNVGMIMMVVVTAFNNAWIPIFYKMLNESDFFSIELTIKKYIKVIFVIAFTLILFSKEIIFIMANSSYNVALDIVPIIIISFVLVFLYTIYANYAFYKKKTLLISFFTFIAAIFNIILNYYYLPIYGYIFAAYSTLFSYFLLFLLHYFNSKYI
ncbi:hypothetical protein CPG38_13860, partial [Malaciobacter marinus]|uniref:lipopolysaccharide biosynthesis protein n=1 Tax=Malaciobacter marinus TaxID=505249 RepID=UPI000C0ACCBA